ncbi:MAG: type II secretion system F family protein, partial [Usitatibacteraceae bacterium]
MPMFQYKAVSSAGEMKEGVMEGSSHAGVIAHLQSTGLIPIRATEVGAGGAAISGETRQPATKALSMFSKARVSQDDLGTLTRELATLLKAGLPLDRSMEILIGLAEKPAVGELLVAIRNDVRGGASLSKALEPHRDIFSRFYVNMVKAGEVGGALGTVLMRLADHMERSKELRDNVVSALIYPTILFLVAVGSVLILVTVVVPQFKQIFDQSGKALPLVTDVVLTLGIFMRNNWHYLFAGVAIVIWLLLRSLTNPVSRAKWDVKFLRWPVMGKLITKVEMAR